MENNVVITYQVTISNALAPLENYSLAYYSNMGQLLVQNLTAA